MTSENNSTYNTIYKSMTNVVTSLYSSDSFELLGKDKDILKIGNILHSIFINRDNIDIPKLVVVGSQSSGKSSILNSILGLDILPTGSDMVTRGPLELELIQSKKDTKACFGEYIDGNWLNLNEITLDLPEPSDSQKNEINSMIQQLTNQYAGNEMNITTSPIYLRIYSPNIPNLSLVDLPGITMVACTDRGQPKDIKERIQNLIKSYIQNPQSIIMAVMPARTDIEADIALDIIKEYDPRGSRTVGVLTKLDLMNDGTDITNLLNNKISRDLQLNYGYYGIKNRNKLELKTMNVLEGLQAEQLFFNNHHIYSNKRYRENMGIPALCKNLSTILVKALKKSLPSISEKINSELETKRHELDNLGSPIPDDTNMRSAYIHKVIARFTRNFITVLEDRGKIINSGRNVKQHFVNFRKEIHELEPFNKKICPDSYINSAIMNCEGNHMSFPSPPVEVLEQLMKDNIKRPIYTINSYAQKCAQNIMNELSELIELLLIDLSIERFPALHKLITKTCLNDVFINNLTNTYAQIDNELRSQENYIWTEDIQFNNVLQDDQQNNVEIMRNLADNYFRATVYILQDTIPKKIMLFLVKQAQLDISTKLYEAIKINNIDELLIEIDDIHEKRSSLTSIINELTNAKELIESIM